MLSPVTGADGPSSTTRIPLCPLTRNPSKLQGEGRRSKSSCTPPRRSPTRQTRQQGRAVRQRRLQVQHHRRRRCLRRIATLLEASEARSPAPPRAVSLLKTPQEALAGMVAYLQELQTPQEALARMVEAPQEVLAKMLRAALVDMTRIVITRLEVLQVGNRILGLCLQGVATSLAAICKPWIGTRSRW